MTSIREEIIKTVFKKCLAHKAREKTLIVTDDRLENLATLFYKGAKRLLIKVTLIKMTPRKMHGEEPPEAIAEALKSVDIALLITEKSLSHTKARKSASKYGTRIASLPGITPEVLERCILIDYRHLKRTVASMARELTRASTLRLTTRKGTDLVMSLKGRLGLEDNGLYISRGDFGNLPAGEACIAPLEGTTSGRLIIDASVAPLGKVSSSIEIIIKNGFIKKVNSKNFASILKPLGRKALNIAELGIGLNPKAKVTGNVLEDEKTKGTAHIAFGDNRSFGGKVSAPCHLDGVFFSPCITTDKGKLI